MVDWETVDIVSDGQVLQEAPDTSDTMVESSWNPLVGGFLRGEPVFAAGGPVLEVEPTIVVCSVGDRERERERGRDRDGDLDRLEEPDELCREGRRS
jgi:hypothetical protein